jgi:hypothetical protein
MRLIGRPPGERVVRGKPVQCVQTEDAHCGWAWGTPYAGAEKENGIDELGYLSAEELLVEVLSWRLMIVPVLRTTGVNTKILVALELGVPLSIATDNIPYDPFFTLWVACARQERRSGQVIGPGQRLDVETALRLFTVEGASLTFDEDWKGPLKPGYAADMAVLSADPTTLPVEALPTVRCTRTLVGGRVVWDATAAGADAEGALAPRGWKCC